MTDLAIPQPSAAVDVYGLCQSIEARLPEITDVGMLNDAKARLGAIADYMQRTNKDGLATIAATMRAVEVRVGEVLPRPHQGVRVEDEPFSPEKKVDLTPKQASEFRAMAANKDIVEDVIAKSTDADPATHKKVMEAIKAVAPKPTPAPKPQRSALTDDFEKAFAGIFTACNRMESLINDDRLRANSGRIVQMATASKNNIDAAYYRLFAKFRNDDE